MLHTLEALFWALLLLVLIVYVFAVLPLLRSASESFRANPGSYALEVGVAEFKV